MLPINVVADQLGIPENARLPYGKDILKIDPTITMADQPHKSAEKAAKLIVVTAVNPTPAGEGKTTVSIGLADAINQEFATEFGNHSSQDNLPDKSALTPKVCALALREPSLGPVFGLKGSAIGGGASQVYPSDKISLHFTGDIHAITAAQNLLCALVDNHIFQKSEPVFSQVLIKRCLDVNDRALRNIQTGKPTNAALVNSTTGFEITAASEMMSIVTLASSLDDLKNRVGRIVVGIDTNGNKVTADELGFTGAVTSLLVDAIQPNLIQTIKGTPTFIHCGPFANVGPGVSSVLATKLAMEYADVVVTEGGFGADLGLEKFLNIKCRQAGLAPSLVVLVATIRALKHHGTNEATDVPDKLTNGLKNVLHHAKSVTEHFQLPVTIAVNRFPDDTPAELQYVVDQLHDQGVKAVVCDPFQAQRADGQHYDCQELAQVALKTLAQQSSNSPTYNPSYELTDDLSTRISKVVHNVYGGAGIAYTAEAQQKLSELKQYDLPICVAKSPISLSGRDLWRANKDGSPPPSDDGRWYLPVTDLELCAGAGFIRVYTGTVLTMPGLGKVPGALGIDVNPETAEITGIS